MNSTRNLRQRIDSNRMLIVPGAYDAIGARMVEQAGCGAVYMTGAGVSLARGYPDLGLLTMTEMVESAAAMARSVEIPVIADADTGYGNELNVTRCVREYEDRGVAAIQLEDQVSPKRCGHTDGKEVVGRDEFVSKIRAAVAARRDPDFLIIARTDARAVVNLNEAILRVNLALAAGADIAFVEAPRTMQEIEAIPSAVNGPCLLNIVPGGRTPIADLQAVEAMGYRLVILPALMLKATLSAGDAALAQLKETLLVPESDTSIAQLFRRFGHDEWDSLRNRFLQANTPIDVVR